ncbi:hypothetical protein MXD63_05535 [Frankia sp. Cpl3]|nr:hypothetical protein [Frankia sp. Cpl3]
MPEREDQLDLPVPVARQAKASRSPSRLRATGIPMSAQWAGLALALLSVPAGAGGWFLAGVLGAPPPAGVAVGVAMFQLVLGYLVLPVLVIRRSRPCAEPMRGRVMAAAARVGRPLSDVRILPNRRGPVHNVGAVGLLGRDHVILGKELAAASPAELEALATHHVARLRTPAAHLVLPAGTAIWVACATLIGWQDEGVPLTVLLTACTGVLASSFAQTMGLRAADRRADRSTAAAVGARSLADAFEKQQQAAALVPPGFSLWLWLALPQPRLPERLLRLWAAPSAPSTAVPAEVEHVQIER